jgi:hypothetical protein
MSADLECIDDGDEGCSGPVEYRCALSATGRSFPRCDAHWARRLDVEDGIRARYPEHAPSDWSPLDAGEAWGENDY